MQKYLNDENYGRNRVENKSAVPDIELRNFAPLQHNALAQVVSGDKGHIPADDQFHSKRDTCK